MKIGDVFIIGGGPAQQTQILINPSDENISPWYSLKDCEKLITPEWVFELNQLRRFK